ncbi:hypothetical protein P22_0727 [Propionispora sp. 2/2-37]|uniref:hypothetical protein n=1 Tax=Propionispora sp. 2/2-37 TaxID=1677858 RepID=UPI0006BB6ADD|nr:hypothetical protein [Propionispora sp. 2/2-37]CUH94661.1 hypothetical protein P22_0727 [Propionispora sp. 2/2-37]
MPVTLAQVGIRFFSEDEIYQVVEVACADGEMIHNEPFAVTVDSVYSAILAADALGKSYLRA